MLFIAVGKTKNECCDYGWAPQYGQIKVHVFEATSMENAKKYIIEEINKERLFWGAFYDDKYTENPVEELKIYQISDAFDFDLEEYKKLDLERRNKENLEYQEEKEREKYLELKAKYENKS